MEARPFVTPHTPARAACAVLAALLCALVLAAPAHAWSLSEAFGDGGSQESGADAPSQDAGFTVGFAAPGSDEGDADGEVAWADSEEPPLSSGFAGGFFDGFVGPGDEADEPAEAAPVPDQVVRPLFRDYYGVLLDDDQVDLDASGDVERAAYTAVGYEAAGLLAWIPADFETVALDGVFFVSMDGDFYVDVTQIYSDFEAEGGVEGLLAFFEELAAEDDTVRFYGGAAGNAAPYRCGLGNAEAYMLSFEDAEYGSVCYSVYVPTLDGGLANMWIEFPLDEDEGRYTDLAEFLVDSIVLVEPGSDPVDVAGALAPAGTQTVASCGVSFAAPGMEEDPEGGWVCYDDGFTYVVAFEDYFAGADVGPVDYEQTAAELIYLDGTYVGSALFEGERDVEVYVYAGVSDDGYLEAYAFVELADGTVTMLAGLAEAYDPASADRLAAVFQSVGLDVLPPTAAFAQKGGEGAWSEGIDQGFLEQFSKAA